MTLKSLNNLRKIRDILIRARRIWIRRRHGVTFGNDVSISMSSRFMTSGSDTISIGDETLIAFKTLIYTTDPITGSTRPVRIGRRCFIGGGATITPGVNIGDECIIGGGAVVMEDVPPRSIVGGNPAQILRADIVVGRFGRLESADENTKRMYYT